MRNTRFNREKNRPFYSLLVGRSFFRWAGVGGKREKGLFWGSGFPQKPVENLLFYLHYFSVGDYLPVKESHPKNITNS